MQKCLNNFKMHPFYNSCVLVVFSPIFSHNLHRFFFIFAMKVIAKLKILLEFDSDTLQPAYKILLKKIQPWLQNRQTQRKKSQMFVQVLFQLRVHTLKTSTGVIVEV